MSVGVRFSLRIGIYECGVGGVWGVCLCVRLETTICTLTSGVISNKKKTMPGIFILQVQVRTRDPGIKMNSPFPSMTSVFLKSNRISLVALFEDCKMIVEWGQGVLVEQHDLQVRTWYSSTHLFAHQLHTLFVLSYKMNIKKTSVSNFIFLSEGSVIIYKIKF